MDCIVPWHEKDKSLTYCLRQLRRHVTQVDRILVVTGSSHRPSINEYDAEYVDENDFLSHLTIHTFMPPAESGVRRGTPGNWIFQQALKFGAAASRYVTSDDYFVCDSDTLFLRPIVLVDDAGKRVLVNDCTWNRIHPPTQGSREYLSRVFGIPTQSDRHFIAHHMVFNRERVRELLSLTRADNWRRFFPWLTQHKGADPVSHWWLGLKPSTLRHFSEYKAYGQFMVHMHPDEVSVIDEPPYLNIPWPMEWFAEAPHMTRGMIGALEMAPYALRSATFHSWCPPLLAPPDKVLETYRNASSPTDLLTSLIALIPEEARDAWNNYPGEFEHAYGETAATSNKEANTTLARHRHG